MLAVDEPSHAERKHTLLDIALQFHAQRFTQGGNGAIVRHQFTGIGEFAPMFGRREGNIRRNIDRGILLDAP